jgi:diadenosine tetraphosphate (Ap4A) HIT family hydrolase
MTNCLFCDKSSARILTESEDWHARFDNYPATPGHVLIVPDRHVGSLFELDEEEIAEGFRLLRDAAWLLTADLTNAGHEPDGWNIGVNDGPAAGQTIPHLHIHLIPRYHGDQDDPRGGIRRGLPNGDPDAWAAASAPLGGTR